MRGNSGLASCARRDTLCDMANLPDRPDPTAVGQRQLRVSDHDREQVAELLRQAAGDGRLTLDELDDRLAQAYAARTFGDLEPLTHDLPAAGTGAAPVPAPTSRVGGTATSHFAISVMGGFGRKGSWVMPRNFTAVTCMGGGTIDLREASFAEPHVTIRAFALMGGIEIVVPEDVEVVLHGVPIMGGIDGPSGSNPPPGAPRVTIIAVAVMGGVDVKVKPPKNRALRRGRS
jgi:Domain of unknown function (DUF1707)/Cell wall-active antibiotics response 4TMS YvqF